MWFPLFRNEHAMPPIDPDEEFDLIVVGSGNGACGFLGECLNHVPADYRVLVLEEGNNFFFTSDITHQNGWSKSYANGNAFTLHNATTPDGKSILSGRAKTLGGGGSINYTMIHESSDWLVKQAGHDAAYWNECKAALNSSLQRPDPLKQGYQTPFADYIADNAQKAGYSPPNKDDLIGNIPSISASHSKQLYFFPTQFDQFGSRTNSGISLVKWQQIKYRWNTKVTGLVMDKKTDATEVACNGVQTRSHEGIETTYKIKKDTGRVILCGGSQSPRILLNTKELASNEKIGQRVNDHICMPLAIYMVDKDKAPVVGATDNYESLFANTVIQHTSGGQSEVGIDFFSGKVTRLIYLISSLYLCFLPFNDFKRFMGRHPIVYTYLSNAIRMILNAIIVPIEALGRFLPFLPSPIIITTALVKFNATKEGYYERVGDKIILRFFDDETDYAVAEEAINQNIAFLESNGFKPPLLIRCLLQYLTKIPYKRGREVKRYVRHFAEKTLLSEQHLAGGCLLGDVVDKGLEDSAKTGLVFGTSNLHVADLSIVPLPRVSTQMTAYLMGHHVAKQIYSTKKKN
jgi:hypothetical protein